MTFNADKQRLRAVMRTARDSIADSDQRSTRILRRLQSLDTFRKSTSIAFYVSIRSEVQTGPALASALKTDKRISVPAVAGDDLELPMSRTDVAIDLVITEQRLVDCRARS